MRVAPTDGANPQLRRHRHNRGSRLLPLGVAAGPLLRRRRRPVLRLRQPVGTRRPEYRRVSRMHQRRHEPQMRARGAPGGGGGLIGGRLGRPRGAKHLESVAVQPLCEQHPGAVADPALAREPRGPQRLGHVHVSAARHGDANAGVCALSQRLRRHHRVSHGLFDHSQGILVVDGGVDGGGVAFVFSMPTLQHQGRRRPQRVLRHRQPDVSNKLVCHER
mmetsp:Transcript_8594/g.21668  ORF Transcript_8594/g.21668 Transcript_8594/m.21668 type:complete len:219 (-) Transcript_8594:272-928(-)